MTVAVGSCTSVGRVRTTNQDWLGAFGLPADARAKGQLFILADGMGGEAGGEVASRLAVDVASKAYFEDPSDDPVESLERSLMAANQAIHAQAATAEELRRMGTTCTALVLRDSRGWIAHVGDSRAYQLRNGCTKRLTSDHSLAERGAAYAHILTRALGIQPEVAIDIVTVPPPLRPGDVFLLCSDGLWGQLRDADMAEIVASEPDLETASRRMVELANARGGPDNISVILVRVDSVGPRSWGQLVVHAIRRAWSAWKRHGAAPGAR